MAILGSAELWADIFPDELIPDILAMVVDVWAEFTQPSTNEHEVPITMRFRAALEQYKDLKRLPLRIDRESPVDDFRTYALTDMAKSGSDSCDFGEIIVNEFPNQGIE
jgi:hypothetical protein